MNDITELPTHLLAEIEHFFDIYKMLEPGKSSSTRGYQGREEAKQEIAAARRRASSSGQ